MSASTGSTDPPGHSGSNGGFLSRTPFQRMLQGWQSIRPNSISSSDIRSSLLQRHHTTLQAELDTTTTVPAAPIVDVPLISRSTPTVHQIRVKPDPEAGVQFDGDSLGAYSPYTRAVILNGGDQSVCRSDPSIVDTIEAVEDAVYEENLDNVGIYDVEPTPPPIVSTKGRLPSPSPLTTSLVSDVSIESVPDVSVIVSPSQPQVPPDVVLDSDDILVYAQVSSTAPSHPVTVKESYEGIGHPYLRGYIGPDRSTQQSQKRFYVVRTGWNPGIFTSWSAAWVRTVDFKSFTGHGAKFASAPTYAAAVRYLGWDPALSSNPRGPFPPPPSVPFVRGPTVGDLSSPSVAAPLVDPAVASRLASTLRAQDVAESTVAEVVRRLQRSFESSPGVPGSGGSVSSSRVETPEGKLRREQKGFPEYPATAFTGEDFDVYYETVQNILYMPHWSLADGSCVTSHVDTPDNDHDREISRQLHYHLVVSIQAHRNPVALSVLSELRSTDDYGNGVKLLESLRAIAYPNNTSSFLHDFDTWSRLSHRNKEDLTIFYRRAKEARHRLSTHSYDMTDFQFRTRFYYLVIKGPYGHAMSTLEEEFKCGRLNLATLSTQELFIQMHQEFRSQCYKSSSSMEVVDGKSVGGPSKGRRVHAGSSDQDDGFTPVGAAVSPSDAKQVHRDHKCILCKILRKGNKRFGPGIHSTAKCPILKECGFTINYDYEKDQVLNPEGRPSSFSSGGGRPSARRVDSGGSGSAPTTGGGSSTRSTDTAGSTPVVVETDTSSTDPTSPAPSPGKSPLRHDGVGRVASFTNPSHSIQVPEPTDDDEDAWSCGSCFTDDDQHSVTSYLRITPGDKEVVKLVTDRTTDAHALPGAPYACRRSHDPSFTEARPFLCPDSGATADMFWDRSFFDDVSYEELADQYVEMGDGSRVPIVGRGTVSFLMDGHYVRLSDCLHVPDLDVHLLSIRTHRRRGVGCTFLADDEGMFLTFPSFVIKVDDHVDTLVPARPLSDSHRGPPEFCDSSGSIVYGRAQKLARRMRTRSQTAAADSSTLSDQSSSSSATASSSPPLPPCYVADTGGAATHRFTPFSLHRLFGNRNLKEFSILSEVGTGITVCDAQEVSATAGDFTTIEQRRRGSSRPCRTRKLDLVGMDIGYGTGTSPGGYNYCLTLVDSATRFVFCYGLRSLQSADIQDALWRFIVDAGGMPRVIQCDFDSRFLGGGVSRFLQSLRINVRSAPPHRQSSNGLVERFWRTGVRMARAFLAESKLPSRFWFWALSESFRRMNILPVRHSSPDSDAPATWTTPLTLFYDQQPDYRVLFSFGAIGYFNRQSDGARSRRTFEAHSFVGIAVGRSAFCNGLLFYNPDLRSFSVSSDYRLDTDRGVADAFPALMYDGGLQLSLLDRNESKVVHPPGTSIYWSVPGSTERRSGTVIQVPTSQTPSYRIQDADGTATEVDADHVWGVSPLKADHGPLSSDTESESIADFDNDHPLRPSWIRAGEAITLFSDVHGFVQGQLQLDRDGDWEFVGRNKQSNNQRLLIPLPDLVQTYLDRLRDGTLLVGWTSNPSQPQRRGRFVSAANLLVKAAPSSLLQLPHLNPTDRIIWGDSYGEEHGSLRKMDVFDVITAEEYERYKALGYKAIPTMNIFTVKPDELGNPYRAKSRIVVLGNQEERVWSNSDRYAPVLQATSCRLLISMAIERGRVAKQGDCKNAFCQPELPEDEVVICEPPRGCPISAPGTYWKLKKTLYGLRRSPRHWYDKFVEVLEKDLGFVKCQNDPCVLVTRPFPDQEPLYVGVYVDDFLYFSGSPEVEKWFEESLGKLLTVDFMGAVTYFLGCRYQWFRTANEGVGVHISQPGFIEQLLEKFHMQDSVPVKTPYRSGLPIDRLPSGGDVSDATPELLSRYRSLIGALTWLTISTRPDIAVAHKLLSSHMTKPTEAHMEAGKHVLRYLRGTSDRGLCFVQKESDNQLHGFVAWPPNVPRAEHSSASEYTDSNWGPQDASRPLPEDEETRTVTSSECKSVQGAMLMRTGGPLWWKVEREERCSRSSCEAEIKSVDMACKEGQHITYLMHELGLSDTMEAIPLYNDNKGAVDWSQTGAITKRLRHLNMREIAVRDSIAAGEVSVHHIPGKTNPADLLTKEHRDDHHFQLLRDLIVPTIPNQGGVGKDEVARRGAKTARTMTHVKKTVSWADVVRGSR